MSEPARDALEEYQSKRDFRTTPEPSGEGARERGEGPIFVIQKHQARNLHYDLRLEVAGVLKSWAVPKGPSTDPRVRRLAVPTEDHPLDYADFEGTIPEGEYGAGTVMVWDTGPYRNLKKDADGEEVPVTECLKQGHVEVWLEGRKLQGGYALVRTGKGDEARWLLVKMKDEGADARRNPVSTEPESVLTGRTLREIAEEEGSRHEP
jgi:DNA ligase D-like protein (predicted 3'-phosphoesterase)